MTPPGPESGGTEVAEDHASANSPSPSEPSPSQASPSTPSASQASPSQASAEQRHLAQETKNERMVWWYLAYFLFGIHIVAFVMIYAVTHAK
ncbi:hypothetical protein [Streptomyces sp. NPDC002851]